MQELRDLAERCKPNKTAGDLEAADLRSMGCAAMGLSRSQMDHISSDALCEGFSDLAACMGNRDAPRDAVSTPALTIHQ